MSLSDADLAAQQADALCAQYLDLCHALMQRVHREESGILTEAAQRLAAQIAEDRLVHIFGIGHLAQPQRARGDEANARLPQQVVSRVRCL